MIKVSEKMIDKLSHLTAGQFIIFSALLDEFSTEKAKVTNVNKRIGIAKDICFPADFDEIDYGTADFFGL